MYCESEQVIESFTLGCATIRCRVETCLEARFTSQPHSSHASRNVRLKRVPDLVPRVHCLTPIIRAGRNIFLIGARQKHVSSLGTNPHERTSTAVYGRRSMIDLVPDLPTAVS